MFDPQIYFDGLARLLRDCPLQGQVQLEPDLKVEYDRQRHWSILSWRFEIQFHSGERLVAVEIHSRREHRHFRKIKYRFMQADGTLLFQVDPHFHQVPFEDVPHLHRGPTEKLRLHEGDWDLNGLSLRGFDFPRMWQLVQDYLRDGSVPWRT